MTYNKYLLKNIRKKSIIFLKNKMISTNMTSYDIKISF